MHRRHTPAPFAPSSRCGTTWKDPAARATRPFWHHLASCLATAATALIAAGAAAANDAMARTSRAIACPVQAVGQVDTQPGVAGGQLSEIAANAIGLVADGDRASWQIDLAAGTARPIASGDGSNVGRARGLVRNGSRAFFHVAPQGADGKPGWWIVVHPPIDARGRIIRLPLGVERPSDLAWTADGHGFVFVQTHDGVRGVWRVPLEEPQKAGPLPRTLLSPKGADVRSFAASSDGRLAWAHMVHRDGKAQYMDIDVRTPDGNVETIVRHALVSALAWSPDGTRLAIGVQDEVWVADPASGAIQWKRRLDTLDKNLYAHHPRSIAWRPDGEALAVVIRFSGGRSAGVGEPMPVILGDREVFVVPLDPAAMAKPIVVSVPGDVEHVTWEAAPRVPG